MKLKLLALTLTASLAGIPAMAQDAPRHDDQPKHDTDKTPPAPQEKSSVTHHDLTLGSRTIHYTATAGTLLIRNEQDEPYGTIFYVAYTEDGVDAKNRPVTFLYNGGPGSASLWLHMGSVGPVRVVTASPEATGPAPYQTVPNQYSLLDKTDLVFIDAPLTGFSKAVGKGTDKDFRGVDQDLQAFDKFIQRYITVNQRWNSPKYLFGESYGTTRSAGLAGLLQEDGVSLNGVILLSSILNYNVRGPGFDAVYVGNLPSYAAIAWYHNKLAHKPADMTAYLDEVRAFARGEYSEALSEGDLLPQEKFDAIAAKVAAYTGLSVEYVKNSKLRIEPTRFRKELLRGEGEILGRYDARFEGTDVDDAGENPGYDPSDTGISGVFIGAFHDYLSRELKYDTTDAYAVHSESNVPWDQTHHPVGGGGGMGRMFGQRMPDVAMDLADAMRKNPKLKVYSANGLFDLATPFFLTEYDLSHMMVTPALAKNVEFGYYPAGHMVYLNVDALKQLTHDLDGFYAETSK
ncbi:S10 family peptidase [Silvibacterium dinghuense]|nr:peptidase S10 [Silvibacterium dinghuense]